MRGDVLVYLSGPMTPLGGSSIEENVAAGLRVHLELVRLGIPSVCPHLVGAFPSAWADVSYAQWLALDLVLVERCTHVLMLPRWESSRGAQLEKAHAEQRGKAVCYSIEELMRSCDAGVCAHL